MRWWLLSANGEDFANYTTDGQLIFFEFTFFTTSSKIYQLLRPKTTPLWRFTGNGCHHWVPLEIHVNPIRPHLTSFLFFLSFIFLHLIEFLLFFYSGFCRWRYDAFFTAQKEDAELMQRISKNVMFWYFNQSFVFQGLLVTTVYIFGNLWCWPWPGLTKNIQLYYCNKSFF